MFKYQKDCVIIKKSKLLSFVLPFFFFYLVNKTVLFSIIRDLAQYRSNFRFSMAQCIFYYRSLAAKIFTNTIRMIEKKLHEKWENMCIGNIGVGTGCW